MTQLSYWSDNAAGYSWWTVGSNQLAWGGTPESIYLKLKAGFDKHRIPVNLLFSSLSLFLPFPLPPPLFSP